MSAISEIVIGTVSGVITSALIFLFIQTFKKVILPWYRSEVYRGIDIEGTWVHEFTAGEEKLFTHRLLLRQNGHDISGESLVTKIHPTETADISQEIVGHVWEGYVILNLLPKDRKRTSYGTLMLKVNNIGRTMSGFNLFRNGVEDVVMSVKRDFHRENGS